MRWTTLDQESNQLSAAASRSNMIQMSTVGHSVEGRPIRAIRVGLPSFDLEDRADIYLNGLQHGQEVAGREALLKFIRDITNVVNLPGSSGDHVSTPNDASLNLAEDIDLRVDVTPDQWNSGSTWYLAGKWQTTGDQRSYNLRVSSTGTLQFLWSQNGTTIVTRSCTVAIPAVDGERLAIRATLDAENSDGVNEVRFYTAPTIDGPWIQLGDPVLGTVPSTAFAGTAVFSIGPQSGTLGPAPGKWHAVQLRDGINGSVVANPDFRNRPLGSASFQDSVGKTWTFNGGCAVERSAARLSVGDLRIVILPTTNPDGFANQTRENVNGVNLNRTHIRLDQPESKAMGETLGKCRPVVAVDFHEALGVISPTDDIAFQRTQSPMTPSRIVTQSQALLNAVAANATANSWPNGLYSAGPGEHFMHNVFGLRQSIGLLVETNRNNDSDANRWKRMQMQYSTIQTIISYTTSNLSALIDEIDLAIEESIAKGAAGEDALNIRTAIIDPPPLGYQLTGILPDYHLNVFNIDINISVVSMAQSAYPVIPFLFDEESEYFVSRGFRLFVISAPPVFADVREFEPIVRRSHHPVFLARVIDRYQTGEDPMGEEISINTGSVGYDATAEIYADLNMTTPGLSDVDRRSLFPRRTDDLLAPYGNEVFVRRGIDLGDRIMWSPLGYFRINTVEQMGTSDAELRIVGEDRMRGIVDADAVIPYFFRSSTTIGTFIRRLITDVYPDAVISYDDDIDQDTLGNAIIVEQSRYAALQELVESRGKVMFVDGSGVFRIEDAPDPDDVVAEIKAGYEGVLVESGRQISREGMNNAVLARGEGTAKRPVKGLAVDIGANSPTRYNPPSKFGRVPHFFHSPLLRTDAMAQRAAEQILRRRIGMPYSVNFGAITNPALRPRDVIRVTQKDGNREKHHIETLRIPLSADGNMTGTTKEKTAVRVGFIDIGRLIL